MHKILLTCPPMIGMVEEFKDEFKAVDFVVEIPEFTQEMSEDALVDIIADYDGWIIGDDPATRRVLKAGVSGNLRACMRWGVGTNNVDFDAFREFNVPIENTPGVFGREVADLACSYVTALARQTFEIDRQARNGKWYKPVGISLWSTKAVIVGMGDIGSNLAQRLSAHDVDISYVDPFVEENQLKVKCTKSAWPQVLGDVDFVIFTAPLNSATYHMFDHECLSYINKPIYVVNVGRGPIVSQSALTTGLMAGKIKAAALDVFEQEPFEFSGDKVMSELKDRIIFGSHNGSNTRQAVEVVSRRCINRLTEMLRNA